MCHVLIIEDEWLLSDHMAQLVEAAGATSIAFAPTEDEAVSAAIGHPPAVMIVDVRLARGTGPQAVRRIVDRLGSLPVLFVTAAPDICGPCDPSMRVLVKPVDDHALVAMFHAIAPLRM